MLEKRTEKQFKINIEEIAKDGLHFGHSKSTRHPKMKPYIFAIRNNVCIIDLVKTAKMFEKALNFIKELVSKKGVILFVGTKIQAKNLIKQTAEECNMPYIIERWLGGTFTNFEVILKRINYLKHFEKKKKEGAFERYSKKERLKLNKIYEKLRNKFEGLKEMKKLPEAIFVLDIRKDKLAVEEARKKGVKIIAVCDTNADPKLVDYPIPANDDAISSIRYILNKVKKTILEAQQTQQTQQTK